MWAPIPILEQCGSLSPDGLHRCAGPRGHLGYHGSRNHPGRDYTWDRGPKHMQFTLGNSGIALISAGSNLKTT